MYKMLVLAAASSVFMVNMAHALDRSFTLANASGEEIYSAYVRHVGGNWGRDVLGDETLDPGWEIEIDPDQPYGYCRFDIKVVYTTDDVQIIRDVNLCEVYLVEVVYGSAFVS